MNRYQPHRAGFAASIPPNVNSVPGYGVAVDQPAGACYPQAPLGACAEAQSQCWGYVRVQAGAVAAGAQAAIVVNTVNYLQFTPIYARVVDGDVEFDILSSVVSGIDSLNGAIPAATFQTADGDWVPITWKGFSQSTPLTVTVLNTTAGAEDFDMVLAGAAVR